MFAGAVVMLLIGSLVLGLIVIGIGIALLVIGKRRHDDSTSRPFLAFGITALVIGTAVAVPSLIWLAMGLPLAG